MWIRKIIASVSNQPLAEVASDSRLTDLGFDSLMFVELQGAIEDGGGRVISPDELNEVQTVREVLAVVQRVDKSKKIADEPKAEDNKDDELYIRRSSKRSAIKSSVSLKKHSTKIS